jgi:hypothetical protein
MFPMDTSSFAAILFLALICCSYLLYKESSNILEPLISKHDLNYTLLLES